MIDYEEFNKRKAIEAYQKGWSGLVFLIFLGMILIGWIPLNIFTGIMLAILFIGWVS